MDPRYPIGSFVAPDSISDDQVATWIERIESLPERLIDVVEALPLDRLAQPYREGGWTRAQVVHHLADSHMNSMTRFRWALTEATPVIKAYDEAAWADLADYSAPIGPSLDLLRALHARWVTLLRSLDAGQLARSFIHPESGETIVLRSNIGIYAWHGDHHLAHLELD